MSENQTQPDTIEMRLPASITVRGKDYPVLWRQGPDYMQWVASIPISSGVLSDTMEYARCFVAYGREAGTRVLVRFVGKDWLGVQYCRVGVEICEQVDRAVFGVPTPAEPVGAPTSEPCGVESVFRYSALSEGAKLVAQHASEVGVIAREDLDQYRFDIQHGKVPTLDGYSQGEYFAGFIELACEKAYFLANGTFAGWIKE